MKNVARLSTRKKPAMSVTVVSRGADATAGSFSSNGTVPPMDNATIVFAARASPITRPR